MGGPVPEEFRASVARLPYSAAAQRDREWHADRVADARAGAGIPHDRAAARAALLWEGMGDDERGGDLGNLPRLLAAPGLGGRWDDIVRQAEAPPEPPPEPAPEEAPEEVDSGPPPEREDPFGPVLALVGPHAPTPAAGGP